jgi:subtilisin family serine protease
MKKTKNPRSAFFQLRVIAGLFCLLSAITLALIGMGSFSSVVAQSKAAADATGESSQASVDEEKFTPADEEGRFVYLIDFVEEGVLRRTQQGDGATFDPKSPQVEAARSQVVAEQAAHIASMNNAIARPMQVTHHYQITHSGIATRLTPTEADAIAKVQGVASVTRERQYELDTFRGPEFIGADTIWNGSAVPGGQGTRGEGVVVAVLDTGIEPTHPSFRNDASCGHGTGTVPNKLLSFLDCSLTDLNGLCAGPSPGDTNGHGTHTASTAAGNVVTTSASPAPVIPQPFTKISGVATCASIRAYKVCATNSCAGADIQAGMNSVLIHGDARVMNFSISGGRDPYNDNDRRKLDLVDANVVVAASAGNTNATITDPVGNVNHLGPWVMTVAASTRDGDFSGILSASGPGTPPSNIQNVPATKGSGSPAGSNLTNAPIRHFTGQPATAEGCNSSPAFPAGFFSGAVALIHRGSCPFTEKITNAFNAGAIMVIIRNNQGGSAALSMSTPGQPNIPAYGINQTAGDALVAFVDANPTTATINFQVVPLPGDVLANFSLRGPTPTAFQHLQKPDITAPGVNIYAAYPFASGNYATLSGTSMSSPHTAGAAALVRKVNPGWTAMEVKSALMMTAFKGGTKENRTTPWDPDDVGNGRADLTKAARAGLVMHETTANMLAANPANGGDLKTLNIPSMRNMTCTPTCSWTRTVRNTRNTPSTWTASASAITPGFQVSVSPSSFSFTGSTSETQQITVTAAPSTNISTAIAFGEVVLTESSNQSPAAHMTVAIKGQPLATSAVSRKNHGGTNFDVALPLLGNVGIEPRLGGATNDYTLIVNFGADVSVNGTPQAAVTSENGTIGSNGSSNGGVVTTSGSTVTVPLTNVTDAQIIEVTLFNVTAGGASGNVVVRMGMLRGDTNADGRVNIGDALQTRSRSGGVIDSTTFRSDVNVDGSINIGDTTAVRSRSGNALPAQ